MTGQRSRIALMFGLVAAAIIGTGVFQSWNLALAILNMGLVSAIMAMGVNMQWGYAGLFNVGVMGFLALGGLAAVLVSMPPVAEAWAAGGGRAWLALVLGAATIAGLIWLHRRLPRAAAAGGYWPRPGSSG
jgi:branched-chain amino acid transport system permease protein